MLVMEHIPNGTSLQSGLKYLLIKEDLCNVANVVEIMRLNKSLTSRLCCCF